MYKKDLALNNLRWLICHQTKPYNYLYYIGILETIQKSANYLYNIEILDVI